MKHAVTIAALALAAPVLAQDGDVFTYEMFETAVQHVNLSECPEALAGEGRFCRMTIHNDAFHVFAFAEAGEQPLVGLKTWYEDEVALSFE